MGKFIYLFVFDLKRSFSRLNLLIIGLFIVICLYLAQSGIDKYKKTEQEMHNYNQLESLKLELHRLNHNIKENNIRIFVMPSIMSVFFGTPTILKSSLSCIPYSETPDIYTSLLNGNEFNNLNIQLLSYSGFILYCGCFIVMMFGFKAFCYKGFLKFLTGFTGSISMIYFATLLSRIFSIILIYSLISAGAFLLANIDGLHFSWNNEINIYVSFSTAALGLFILFLLLGILIGTINKRSIRIWGLAATWIILLLIIPAALGKYFADRSYHLSPSYRLGINKLKLLVEHEKNNLKQGKSNQFYLYQYNQAFYNFPENRSETKSIMKLHRKFCIDYAFIINDYISSAALFPTTFCLSLEREAGGGFIHLFYLYRHSLDIENIRNITIFRNLPLMDNTNYPPRNIYQAKAFLPGSYSLGWWIIVIYILIFLNICYTRLKGWVFGPYLKKYPDSTNMELIFNPGENRMIRAPGDFVQLFFNRFTGGTKIFQGILELGEIKISESENRQIIYLTGPEMFPGNTKVNTLFHLIRKFGNMQTDRLDNLEKQLKEVLDRYFKELSQGEQAWIVLSMMAVTDCKIYILDDFYAPLELNEIKRLDEMFINIRKQGGVMIYFYKAIIRNVPLKSDCLTVVCENKGVFDIDEF
jgi:hypothetical protein